MTATTPARYGVCEHITDEGRRWVDPTPPEACWADTAPWADYCPDHGGPNLDDPDPYTEDEEEDEPLTLGARLAPVAVFLAAVFGPSTIAYHLFGTAGLS